MIDWEELRYQGDSTAPEASRPVEMSSQESLMSNEVEELSEDMRRENDLEVRKAVGKTSLAFVDLENMTATMKTAFVLLAVILFSGIGIFFYNALFVKEESNLSNRRAKLDAKRGKMLK